MGFFNIIKIFDRIIHYGYLRRGFVSKEVHLNGNQIHYYDNQREGVPVLFLIHGFGIDGKISWKNQAKGFTKNYRVIVPDLLWFGKSLSNHTPNLQSQVDAMHALINHLNLKHVHLVGISYGGFVSIAYSHLYQNDVETLTIVDSPGIHFTDQDLQELCKAFSVDELADAFIPRNADEVKRLILFSSKKQRRFSKRTLSKTIGFYVGKHPAEQRLLMQELLGNRERFRDLDVDIPCLVIWGEEDKIFSLDKAKALQKQLDAELVIIPDAGHVVVEEQPKLFNQALKNFLERTLEINK